MALYEANTAKAAQHFESAIRPKLLKRTLSAWKIRVRRDKAASKMVPVMDALWRQQGLALALQTWASLTRSQRRARQIETHIRSNAKQRMAGGVWGEWRFQLVDATHIKQALHAKRAELSRRCFTVWRAFGRKEKALRAKTTFVEKSKCICVSANHQSFFGFLRSAWKYSRCRRPRRCASSSWVICGSTCAIRSSGTLCRGRRRRERPRNERKTTNRQKRICMLCNLPQSTCDRFHPCSAIRSCSVST